MSLKAFMNETASESPAPGGGSVSAYIGALGVALGSMVANLSSHKRGWDERWKEFSDWAEKGKAIQERLLMLVDEDTIAFNGILAAADLPKKNDSEIKLRNDAIQEATKKAILVPFMVMETAFKGFKLIREMAEKGNPNSVTDAAVGALAVGTCIRGAHLNVKINCASFEDKHYVEDILNKSRDIAELAVKDELSIIQLVEQKIQG